MSPLHGTIYLFVCLPIVCLSSDAPLFTQAEVKNEFVWTETVPLWHLCEFGAVFTFSTIKE